MYIPSNTGFEGYSLKATTRQIDVYLSTDSVNRYTRQCLHINVYINVYSF